MNLEGERYGDKIKTSLSTDQYLYIIQSCPITISVLELPVFQLPAAVVL